MQVFVGILNNKTNILKTINGFDKTKTQILKNINGTFTWVDEEE